MYGKKGVAERGAIVHICVKEEALSQLIFRFVFYTLLIPIYVFQ
jgi:hypothetical protein